MAQLQRGETFIDGQTVTAARLNNLVDLATALNGLIMDRGISGVTSSDQVLLWDDGTNALRRTSVQTLLASAVGVTNVALTMPGLSFNVTGSPITSTGTLAVTWDVQAKNKVLIGPETGANATPTWRTLEARDTTTPTVIIADDTIDWRLGNTFYKWLTANQTLYFVNATAGQTIVVRLQNGASWSMNWPEPDIRWPNSTVPVMSAGAGRGDVYTFHYINGTFLGSYYQNY